MGEILVDQATGTRMSNWISKAVNVFRRDIPEVTQPFDVLCECGQGHTGIRRARYQHLVCKSCGASLFVLPRDAYPPPQLRPRKSPAKTAKTPRKDTDADLPVLLESDVIEGEATGAPRSEVLPPSRPTKRQSRRQQQREGRSDDEEFVLEPPKPGLVSVLVSRIFSFVAMSWLAVWRFWTPFRLLAAVMLAFAALTGWWMVRQNLLSQAVSIAKEKAQTGIDFIKQERWPDARTDLEAATRALDRLGRHDPEAEDIRQYYRECLALTRMNSESIFEMLEEAHRVVSREDGEEAWKRTFTQLYQGNWLVIEGNVQEVSGSGGYALRIPWAPGGKAGSVTIRADFPVFDRLVPLETGREAIFAGGLTSCEPPNDEHDWIVRLDASSGFLWVNFETYRHLGFTLDPTQTQAKLEEKLRVQAEAMGVIR
jgi:hypothetical protein